MEIDTLTASLSFFLPFLSFQSIFLQFQVLVPPSLLRGLLGLTSVLILSPPSLFPFLFPSSNPISLICFCSDWHLPICTTLQAQAQAPAPAPTPALGLKERAKKMPTVFIVKKSSDMILTMKMHTYTWHFGTRRERIFH